MKNRFDDKWLNQRIIRRSLLVILRKAETSQELLDIWIEAKTRKLNASYLKEIELAMYQVRLIEKKGMTVEQVETLYRQAINYLHNGELDTDGAISWLEQQGVPVELLGE